MKVKRLTETAKLPTKAHKTDAGYDLYSDEDTWIKPGEVIKVKTGLSIEIPYGHVGLLWDRSSMALKGIKIAGGVVDHGYIGEIMAIFCNLSNKEYYIHKGDKITQLVLQKVEHDYIEEVIELNKSVRGTNGFGSSGK